MKKYRQFIRQGLLFGVVGLITLGIDVGVTSMLYYLLSFPPYLASAIGFCSGFFFNFPMNRHKVFAHTDKDRFSLHSQISMVAILSLFNLFATSAMVEVIVTNDIADIQYAKIFVTALIAVWNFLLFKFFIFSKRT